MCNFTLVTTFSSYVACCKFSHETELQSIAEPKLSIADVIGLILVQTTGVNTRASKKIGALFMHH
jgi:hypothetical protein